MKYVALFLAALLFTTPALAQKKDSYYFMADDGEQSPEEMLEEAQYVFDVCDANTYQKIYFDCQCLAGSFLQAREKYGAVAPQEELVNDIIIGKNARCANTTQIAGIAYSQCKEYAALMREYNKDNEEYCTCVGNTAAQRFSRQPYLSTNYITSVQADALVDCNQRDNNNNPIPARN